MLAVYLVLAVLLFREGWSSPTARNIGGPNDPLFNMWVLRWTPWALANGQNPLFTDHLNFPWGVNLMWNAFLPLHGLLLWPVTAAAGPVLSYNLMVTANVALSAWCAYLALRAFVASRLAAFAGGLLYGFSPFMMAQSLDHPSLSAAYVPPLLLVALHEILMRQSRPPARAGVVLGLLAAVQLYIAEEMLAAQALVCAIGLLVLVALNRRAVMCRVRHAATAMATGLGVFVVLTAWALRFQFLGPQRITGGSVQPRDTFVSDLINFVVPTSVQAVAPGWAVSLSRHWTGNLSEWDAYLGLPLIVLLVGVAVRLWRRPVVRFAAVVAVVVSVLSLGPHLHVQRHSYWFPLPWRAVEAVPLLGHILPARLMVFVFLMAAVLVAVLVDHLVTTRPWRSWGRWRRVAAAVGGLAVVATLLPDLSYPATRVAVPRFFTDGSARLVPEGSVALIAPMQQLYPADPMLWQAEADLRFRMPQGYFFAPDEKGRPRYGAPWSALSLKMYDIQEGRPMPELTPELRSLIGADLAARQVETVLVGPMRHQDRMVEFFRALLGPPSRHEGGVFVWQRVHRLLR